MKEPYTAVIKHSGDWWIGWIEKVPGVNCQEETREELLETLLRNEPSAAIGEFHFDRQGDKFPDNGDPLLITLDF